MPSVYQSTTSPPVSGRLAEVHRVRPSPPADWLGNSPAAYRSLSAYAVTHTAASRKPARFRNGLSAAAKGSALAPGTSS